MGRGVVLDPGVREIGSAEVEVDAAAEEGEIAGFIEDDDDIGGVEDEWELAEEFGAEGARVGEALAGRG